MIFDYTPEEMQQLAEIDEYYAGLLDKVDAAAVADPDYNRKEYPDKYIAQRDRLEAECLDKLGALYETFEQKRFDALQGDPDTILANGKEQIDTAIKKLYNANKVLEKADPRIEKSYASRYLDMEIRRHLDYLKENAPKQFNSLRNYKNRYLGKSPLVTDDKKQQPAEQPQAPADDLLTKEYYPMLNNTATNDFTAVSLKKQADKLSKSVNYTSPHDAKLTIENIDKIYGGLSTPTQKIMYTAISYLTRDNYRKGGLEKATIEIPLYNYADANGRDTSTQTNLDNFVKETRNSLHDLKQVNFSWNKKKGGRLTRTGERQIISSYEINTECEIPNITITFDPETARDLMDAGIMYFPKVLLKHDNRNPNGFSIGYAIAVHNSNLQNRKAGTAETLRVETLLADAPEIPKSPDELTKNNRNWKKQIKEKLEKALDSNVNIGYLDKWEYRNGRTCEIFTKEQASKLSWTEFNSLRVDYYIAKENPELEDYTRRKEKEKATAEKQKSKRQNRDKKKGNKVGTTGTLIKNSTVT